MPNSAGPGRNDPIVSNKTFRNATRKPEGLRTNCRFAVAKDLDGSKISKLKQSYQTLSNLTGTSAAHVSRGFFCQNSEKFAFIHFISDAYAQPQCIRLLLMGCSMLFLSSLTPLPRRKATAPALPGQPINAAGAWSNR